MSLKMSSGFRREDSLLNVGSSPTYGSMMPPNIKRGYSRKQKKMGCGEYRQQSF